MRKRIAFSTSESQKVFFALWPSQPVETMLLQAAAEIKQQWGGRTTRDSMMHLTLAYIGDVQADGVAALKEIAKGIRVSAFTQTFDCLVHHADRGIVWAGCSSPNDALMQLGALLRARLIEKGFSIERRPFRPHVTLLRNVREVGNASFPAISVEWPVHEFALVASTLTPRGSRYKNIAFWTLRDR